MEQNVSVGGESESGNDNKMITVVRIEGLYYHLQLH
jgi:hypothetical protein